jgi:hypothetical protein
MRTYRTTALEFTVSVPTAQKLAPNTATDDERAILHPIRCRILVPSAERGLAGGLVEVFVREENELGEMSWVLLGSQGPVVAGLVLWHRLVTVLALHAMVRSLDPKIRRNITETPKGVIIDLGEV